MTSLRTILTKNYTHFSYYRCMSVYRLYIDESGHHRYQRNEAITERYLGLTGIIINKDVYDNEVIKRVEQLRSHFYTDHDLRPPLHLTDIMASKNGFAKLQEADIRKQFDGQLLSLLKDVDYQIITVVIDKNGHQDKYVTPEHPYHYSLTCMLERYCKFLKYANAKGDVMAEARGKKEDRKIEEVYSDFYANGTNFANATDVQARLTSKEIKMKTKYHLIHGLEFADLIALNSKIDILHSNERIETLDNNFTKTVIEAIQPKYYTGATGPKGNGKKFL